MTIQTQRAPDAHERAGDVTREQLSNMWVQAKKRAERKRISSELRTLDAVRTWYTTRDMFDPPSVRDIADIAELGISTVSVALRSLHRAGLVHYTGKARGLWLPEHKEAV